jgi:hypothetical protein
LTSEIPKEDLNSFIGKYLIIIHGPQIGHFGKIFSLKTTDIAYIVNLVSGTGKSMCKFGKSEIIQTGLHHSSFVMLDSKPDGSNLEELINNKSGNDLLYFQNLRHQANSAGYVEISNDENLEHTSDDFICDFNEINDDENLFHECVEEEKTAINQNLDAQPLSVEMSEIRKPADKRSISFIQFMMFFIITKLKIGFLYLFQRANMLEISEK